MPVANPEFPVTTLIVDDEELARSLIGALVRKDPDLMLVDECGDGATALEVIETKRPDLVFLDIQMPLMNGLAVAERLAGLGHVPYVIFVTAFDDFAVKAFELNALDYLVKPLEKNRFRSAVDRAKQAIRNGEMLAITRRLLQLSRPGNGRSPTRGFDEQELTVRNGDSIVQLTTSDVAWIEAANQYVHIHAGARTYTVSESLSQYAKRISDARFFRIHRSALVNASEVASVTKQRNGTHLLKLRNGEKLVVARSKASIVPDILRVARLASTVV